MISLADKQYSRHPSSSAPDALLQQSTRLHQTQKAFSQQSQGTVPSLQRSGCRRHVKKLATADLLRAEVHPPNVLWVRVDEAAIHASRLWKRLGVPDRQVPAWTDCTAIKSCLEKRSGAAETGPGRRYMA